MKNDELSDENPEATPTLPENQPEKARNSEYQVGYRRPPIHSRFKPGETGNRKGRPKEHRNHRTIVEQVFNEKITIREGKKTRKVTKFEAMLQATMLKAMKGDPRAANTLLGLLTRMQSFLEGENETPGAALPEEDAAIIREYARRKGVSSTRPEEIT